MTQKTAYIAVIGRPNVGKSSLINRIVGQKIAITSNKPQTTRHALLGIHTVAETQLIFVDTPGIHEGKKAAINRHMNRQAWQSLEHVDLIVQLCEWHRWEVEDQRIADGIAKLAQAKILVVNKIDRMKDKDGLLTLLPSLETHGSWQALIPLSARKGDNVAELEKLLLAAAQPAPWPFPAEQITTAGMRFMAAEIIREKLFRLLHQELPYELGVVIDRYCEEGALTRIDATILVERPSQKGMVIGNRGQTLKRVGQRAREEIEKMIEGKVMLRTWVKVVESWRDDERLVHSMGRFSGIDEEA